MNEEELFELFDEEELKRHLAELRKSQGPPDIQDMVDLARNAFQSGVRIGIHKERYIQQEIVH